MLAERVVRSIRAALVVSQAPDAQTAARVLDVVLEEVSIAVTASALSAKPEDIEELKSVIELQAKSIREFANDLEATRRRAEVAEAKLVEMKRGG